jgi:hypothetical protein
LQEDLLGNGMLMIIINDPHRPQTIKKGINNLKLKNKKRFRI